MSINNDVTLKFTVYITVAADGVIEYEPESKISQEVQANISQAIVRLIKGRNLTRLALVNDPDVVLTIVPDRFPRDTYTFEHRKRRLKQSK